MYRIICDISGIIYQYEGDGNWAVEGLPFATKKSAQEKLDADLWRINPRVRSSVKIAAM